MSQEIVAHYRLKEPLGSGAMGEVWLAEDTRLHRLVALKMLARKDAGDAEAAGRLLREARVASSLSHPNVAVVYDVGETERDGKPGALGWSMRRLEELQGEDPDRVYSAMEGVRHVLVQESAGLTQTINEMAAQLGISGREFLSNPDVFFEHYDELKRRLNENLATTYASQNPAIQSQLDQQLGANNPFDQKQEPLNLPDIPDQGPVRDMMPGNDAVKRVIQSVRSKPVDEKSDEEVIRTVRALK